ncbi:uncharacterized protein [Eurosta solidaginis]|uniref:uncharacterized protein isoform X1 n=1 Tax=Eurosta solidaginis TaxID=178769 RepID=UPI003530C26A
MPKLSCFVCDQNFLSTSAFISHIKVYHGVPDIYKFICKFESCDQMFTNIYRFQKHVDKHIKDLNLKLSIEIPKQNVVEESEMNIEHSVYNSIEQFRTFNLDFKKSIIYFLLNLHNNPNFSRKSVLDIQHSITENITAPICEVIKLLIVNNSNELFFKEIMHCIYQPFSFVDTEYKFFNELENMQYFKPPKKYVLSNELSVIALNNNPTLTGTKTEITLVDIPFQIKKFLESDSVLKEIISCIQEIANSHTYSTFLSGSLWIKCYTDPTCLTIPLFLYLDDFEINDPLGSKCGQQKICGIIIHLRVCERAKVVVFQIYLSLDL